MIIFGADQHVSDGCPLPLSDLDRGTAPGYQAEMLQILPDPAAGLTAQLMRRGDQQRVFALQGVGDVVLCSGVQDRLSGSGPDPPVLGVVGQRGSVALTQPQRGGPL